MNARGPPFPENVRGAWAFTLFEPFFLHQKIELGNLVVTWIKLKQVKEEEKGYYPSGVSEENGENESR